MACDEEWTAGSHYEAQIPGLGLSPESLGCRVSGLVGLAFRVLGGPIQPLLRRFEVCLLPMDEEGSLAVPFLAFCACFFCVSSRKHRERFFAGTVHIFNVADEPSAASFTLALHRTKTTAPTPHLLHCATTTALTTPPDTRPLQTSN